MTLEFMVFFTIMQIVMIPVQVLVARTGEEAAAARAFDWVCCGWLLWSFFGVYE